MGYTIRANVHRTVTLTGARTAVGSDIRELADSITEVGLLRPLIVDGDGSILDGAKRAAALRLLGERTAPAITVTEAQQSTIDASTLRGYAKTAGRKDIPVTGSRSTLERVDKVIAIAEDVTLPLTARVAASEGVAEMAAGASANGVLTRVSALLSIEVVTVRYPDLAHLPDQDALRLATYLDALDSDQREVELEALRLTRLNAPTDRGLAMSLYTHMQDLAHVVDQERANEVAATLAAAISGDELTPALRERCLDVADLLEKTAAGIRAAMTLELTPA